MRLLGDVVSRKLRYPFLSAEQHSRIAYSETPLSISVFISKLNSVRPAHSKINKLSYTEVVTWLAETGYLEIVPNLKPGVRAKVPTEKEKAIGISWERRHSSTKDEDYMVALYNVAAQRFNVSNLDEILLFAQHQ